MSIFAMTPFTLKETHKGLTSDKAMRVQVPINFLFSETKYYDKNTKATTSQASSR